MTTYFVICIYVCLLCRKLEYLHNNLELPIYERNSQTYSARTICEILLDEGLSTNKIATSHPVSIQENLVFVVDLSQLHKPEDVRANDRGSWVCNSKQRNVCEVEDRHVTKVFSGPSIKRENAYCLVRRYYKHATSGDFRRTIAEIYGKLLFVHNTKLVVVFYM